MKNEQSACCTAFSGVRQIATGELLEVARLTKQFIDKNAKATILIFDNKNSDPIEIDFRGSENEVLKRLEQRLQTETQGQQPLADAIVKGPGRPKLGVVAREVTLLPAHWEWLSTQPGGASVALRKLVEVARKANSASDQIRLSQEATYRFISAMAGNFSNFEEATRALFAADFAHFENHIAAWPEDIRKHILLVSKNCFLQNTEV